MTGETRVTTPRDDADDRRLTHLAQEPRAASVKQRLERESGQVDHPDRRDATVEEEVRTTDAGRRHILVINDSPPLLDLFRELLEDEGFQVTTDTFSVEVDQLLARIKTMRLDLVILDLIVGGERLGLQLLQMMKMDRATRDLPVIICTAAHTQAQEMESHLDQMGVAVVLKPFNIDHLLSEIQHVLDRIGRRQGARGASV